MSLLPSAAEPQPDLTGKTIAGFFAAAMPLAVVVVALCFRELGAF